MKPTTTFTATQSTTDAYDLDALVRHAPATDDLLELADWLAGHGTAHLSAIARIELAERLITRRRFIIRAGALGLGVITGCGPEEEPASPTAMVEGTRTVTHEFGTSKVPVEPTHVVVLHQSIAEVVVVLGVEPMAIGTDLGESYPYLEQRLPKDIENVGEPPNLEALLALEPDLIIGFDNLFEAQENYEELSQIASTVAIRHGASSAEWKRQSREVAEALGKTEEFEAQLAAYEARAMEIGRRLGVPHSAPTAAIMLTWDATEGMRFDLPRIFSGSVLYEDVGLPLPEGLREPAAAGEFTLVISRELFDQGDADELFLYSQSRTPEHLIEEIREDPLFQTLKSVESGNVYAVESHWFNGSLIAANLILDDLEQLLLEGEGA